MAEHSTIEWTDATWNPVTGCTLVDEGCRHCYAATLAATRLKNHPSRAGLARINAAGEAKFTGEVRFNEQWLADPLRWKRPRRIFVCAHADLFHPAVPDAWIDQVFAVMALTRQHTFQILTKRPDRARAYLNALAAPHRQMEIRDAGRKAGAKLLDLPDICRRITALPLPNVWLGTSISDQASADQRIPDLLATPAAVRFLSAEPLLGPVDLHWAMSHPIEIAAGFLERGQFSPGLEKLRGLDWIICGGESGAKARPMNPQWARDLRDQCVVAGVAFFFKQWGEWVSVSEVAGPGEHFSFPDHRTVRRTGKKLAGRLLDGHEWNEVPA